MSEFEHWQMQIINDVRRSMPALPKRLTIEREQLPDGALGHAIKRSDGSYAVLLDPPATLSIGAFRYVVRHELEHIAQGHPHLLREAGRLLLAKMLTIEQYHALEDGFELTCDIAVEQAGYTAEIAAWLKCYPDDRLRTRDWEPAVRQRWDATLDAIGKRIDERRIVQKGA